MRLALLALFATALLLLGCAGQVPSSQTGNPQPGNQPGGMAINTSVKINGASALPAATSGQLYSAKITVSGGSGPYNCSSAPGTTLPGTLVFSEPGCSLTGGAPTLAPGTPTAIYPVSIMVNDSQGTLGGPFALTLVVNQPAPKLLLPGEIATAETGTHYQYNFCEPASQTGLACGQLAASNLASGTPPFSFTVSGNPLGISMSTNGMLSGTVPRGVITGNYKITVCATDLAGTEACANTNLPVIEKQEAQAAAQPACPGEGNWKGTVTARGIVDVIGKPGQTAPYSVKYDLEITVKCDSAYLDESGARSWFYNITHAKASDPFFGCTEGCVPVAGTWDTRLSYLDITEGSSHGHLAIRFPNDALIQRTNTVLSADGTKLIDDVQPQAGLGAAIDIAGLGAMATGSVGWKVQTGAKVEVPGCTDSCPNAYPDRETVELTRAG